MGKLGKTMAAIPDGMADRTDPIDGYDGGHDVIGDRGATNGGDAK